jgi:oligoribonuclease NrnB/cAMP/cGMP phosphodiesterase (DHH superfamily)
MSERSLVIYHSPCLDGFTAAWAFWLKEPDAEFVPGVYGQNPPDVYGRDVYLLDFSYKRDVMLQLMQQARSVTVLDHHKTAEAELANLDGVSMEHHEYADVELVFDMTKSGARLAWERFHPETKVPRLVRYVEDRDLWKFALPDSKAVNAALFSYAPSFEQWDILRLQLTTNGGYNQLVDAGEAIERKQAKDVLELTRLLKHRRVIGGTEVWCANLPYTLASDAAGLLAEGEPFGATYFIDAEGYAVFSLRSRGDGMDVSEIAKGYGGGGHKNAAGFRIQVTAIDHDLERDVFLGGLNG